MLRENRTQNFHRRIQSVTPKGKGRGSSQPPPPTLSDKTKEEVLKGEPGRQ